MGNLCSGKTTSQDEFVTPINKSPLTNMEGLKVDSEIHTQTKINGLPFEKFQVKDYTKIIYDTAAESQTIALV